MRQQTKKTFMSKMSTLATISAIVLLGTTQAMAEVKARIGHAMPDTHPQAMAMSQRVQAIHLIDFSIFCPPPHYVK